MVRDTLYKRNIIHLERSKSDDKVRKTANKSKKISIGDQVCVCAYTLYRTCRSTVSNYPGGTRTLNPRKPLFVLLVKGSCEINSPALFEGLYTYTTLFGILLKKTRLDDTFYEYKSRLYGLMTFRYTGSFFFLIFSSAKRYRKTAFNGIPE